MIRLLVALWLAVVFSGPSLADQTPSTATQADAAFQAAMRQAIGGPERAAIPDEASYTVPMDFAAVPPKEGGALLAALGMPVPDGLAGVLLGADGVDSPGTVRFVKSGFIDADGAIAWSADDILSSLDDTIQARNADRVKSGLLPLEARRWVLEPSYKPESHVITWAALVVAKDSPPNTEGMIEVHAISFGRDGYVELVFPTSVERADFYAAIAEEFLSSIRYAEGKGYGDATSSDKRAPRGLAGAMGLLSLHHYRAPTDADGGSGLSDGVIPIVGGGLAVVALLAGLAMFVRYRRSITRRV